MKITLTKRWEERKEREEKRKEREEKIDMQSKIEVDEEDLCILKINYKGQRTVGKGNKGINVEKI